MAIATLGFRGEALPSIGAVARLVITTRHASEPNAWAIEVDAGAKSQVKPAALSEGTRVEVRDLFYATPARLKFLKTDRTEAEAIRDVVRRLAMSRPDVAFTLAGEERAPVTWGAALPGAAGQLARLGDVLGPEFRAERRGGARRARGAQDRGLCGLADLLERQRAEPVSVRQRPPGARQADARRGAWRLCGLPAARPPSGGRAVRHDRAARGRRERASGEVRGALPRFRPGARLDRARIARGARARHAACRHHGRQRDGRVVPAERRAAHGLELARFAGAAPDAGRDRIGGLCRGRAGGVRRRRAIGGCAGRCGRHSARPARPAARRGARAAARHLCGGADARRHRDRRPACRA